MKYLLVGSGRLATHLNHYIEALGLPLQRWARSFSTEAELQTLASEATHILLAISDRAIDSFIENHPEIATKRLIHFSGCHQSSVAHSAHPLMSFPPTLFELSDYQKVPFVLTMGSPDFEELLPGFTNPHFRIDDEKKPLYHAYCVLGGNFTVYLWQQFFKGMMSELKLPEEALIPYLEQITKNLKEDWSQALTGPLVRKDEATIKVNIEALRPSPLAELYSAFVKTYSELESQKGVRHEPS